LLERKHSRGSEAFKEIGVTRAFKDVRNRMPVSLRRGGGELGNLKP
jgi:hypothetical protein